MRKALFALIACIVLLIGGLLVLKRTYERLLRAPAPWPAEGTVTFRVSSGSGAGAIARGLAERELIRSAAAFRYFVRRKNWHTRLKPGIYRIAPGTDSREIARSMVEHEVWRIAVVIPEGFTLDQIAARVESAGEDGDQQWLAKAQDLKAAANGEHLEGVTGIDIPAGSAEGYLFPATYRFDAGMDAEEIAARMFGEFAQRFADAYSGEIRKHELSLHELVTLASIVEREAAEDRERPLIAGVFLNRLRLGMKLESCATVQYALGEHKPQLSYSDLRVRSPYNTYIHKGLPPGPICSPGQRSLLAALNPAQTEDLYFVSKGDGTHQFSRSLQGHENAKRRIRTE